MKLQARAPFVIALVVILLVVVGMGLTFLSALVGVFVGVVSRDYIPDEWVSKLNRDVSNH